VTNMSVRKGGFLYFAALLLLAALLLMPNAMPVFASPEQFPVNKYGWLDTIVFFGEKDRSKAINMMVKGDMDAYFIDIPDPDLYRKIKQEPTLAYDFSFGLYYELTFNPATFKTGEFNPFTNPRIREAINYIVDRNYIVNEIMGGLATPKFLPIIKVFPEGKRYADEYAKIEKEYAYDFAKGKAIIEEEMKKMGATLVGGKWQYQGKPVVIKFIIRVEDARKKIGDYVAGQLEKVGFTVERMYKTSREASPLWLRGDPAEGKWSLYTGGWITTVVSRDDADVFTEFYTPDGSLAALSPLWRAYKPDPVFRETAKRLFTRNFTSMTERNVLMKKAMWMAMKDSVRVWLVDQNAVWARRKDINLVADYAAGYSGMSWAFTANKGLKFGGMAKIGSAEVIVDPWNPVAGSNWIYDSMIYDYATRSRAFLRDPKTGMAIPLNVKSVDMEVLSGLPITRSEETKSWFNLTYVSRIDVPGGAWYRWNVKEQRMVTAREAGVKFAQVKFTVNYGSVLGRVAYHDGSVRSLADFIMPFIVDNERASPDSKIYDESWVDPFHSTYDPFLGWRIVSKEPLIIEYYLNYTLLDAELIAAYYTFWPSTPWHAYYIGILAEENKELAFSADKAGALNIEWMNYIAGPSLAILEKYLDKALKEGLIPYREFFGALGYITVDEAKNRYSNYMKFYKSYGHFWINDGPYFVERADAIAHTCTIKSIRLLPYKIEEVARDIAEFTMFPYTTVGIGYDKEILNKVLAPPEIKSAPEGVSLIVGGPLVNTYTKQAFDKAGIKMDSRSLVLPTGEKFADIAYGKTDYGIAILIGKDLYVAGMSRYGTEAALLYITKNKVNFGTVIVKWQDVNGNGQVELDEVSVVLQKL